MDTQESTDAVEATFPPRAAAVVWVPVVFGVGILVIAAVVSGHPVVVGLGVPAMIGAAILGVSLSYRVRRARVVQARPAAVIYDGLLSDDLRQASLLLGQGPLNGSGMTVALTHDALEIWGRNRHAPELVVPWTDAVRAAPGQVKYTRQFHAAVIVDVETDAGRARIPISIAPSSIVGLPSVDSLNGLLASIRGRIRSARTQRR